MSDFLEARLDARDESCGLCSGDVEAMLSGGCVVYYVCGCVDVCVCKSGNSTVVVVEVQSSGCRR